MNEKIEPSRETFFKKYTAAMHKWTFCKTVFVQEKEETEDEMVFFSSSSLIKKKKDTVKENKTLELCVIENLFIEI